MASIKLKFRPSSVKGKKGVLSYQIIHYRLTRLIKTSYRIMPSEWDDSTGSLLISTQAECKARLLLIRDQTNWEMTRLQGLSMIWSGPVWNIPLMISWLLSGKSPL